MQSNTKNQDLERLHPRNRNRERYDLNAMIQTNPSLKAFVKTNKFGDDSIDFSSPTAVKVLNQALLNHYYGIAHWDFSNENLCPPIPGRADYIHHVADLLSESNGNKIPKGQQIKCLDIGVGATCIYPIIGVTEYDWYFVGSDIDPNSIASAEKIVALNPSLKNKIELRLQKNKNVIFSEIIGKNEHFDLTICNPPFHASLEDAQKGTRRKIKNLTGQTIEKPDLNFAGNSNELICEGGEIQFLQDMISESKHFAENCRWFTSLVSKESNLKAIYNALKKVNAIEVKTIPMGTGNKISRIVAWTFKY
ncbi:MAG: 23S rRNA (adenine(1618)-N(6))-methyltransferase RlmF [Bacteroidota bacterium]